MVVINDLKNEFIRIDHPSKSNNSSQIVCCYINQTREIQSLKITNDYHYYWQEVVLPSQRFLFEALLESKLEIYTYSNNPSMIDVIPCQQLAITTKKIQFAGIGSEKIEIVILSRNQRDSPLIIA